MQIVVMQIVGLVHRYIPVNRSFMFLMVHVMLTEFEGLTVVVVHKLSTHVVLQGRGRWESCWRII